MTKESLSHNTEIQNGVKRVNLSIPEDLMAELERHAIDQDVLPTHLLKALIRLRNWAEGKVANTTTLQSKPNLHIQGVVIDPHQALSEFSANEQNRRFILTLTHEEYAQAQRWAIKLGENVNEYVRIAIAIGLKIENTADKSTNPQLSGYPISIGELDFLAIW